MPDPVLLLAAAGWLAALALLALWRRAAPYAPECRLLRERARDGDARAERDSGEIRRLAAEEAGLRRAVEGLERQMATAAEAHERHAAESRAEHAALSAKLDAARDERAALLAANERLRAELAARAERHDEEVALLKGIREDMTDRFKRLAEETMRQHGDNFVRLNDDRLRALLEPMKLNLSRFQDELRQTHEGASKDRERLQTEIENLTKQSARIGEDAVALARALKGDKQRQGAWGEMVLERLLEDSGLARGREYETQLHVRAEDGGRRRPDVVVRLPGDKAVVIDAKVSLVAYEAAVRAETDAERDRQLRAHVAALRKHIDDLAARDYAGLVDGSVDYVLMFLPIEGALAEALRVQGDLTAYAIERRVGIATPTTLMMALRTVQHVWGVERRESHAEEIAKRAGYLFDKMAGVMDSFEKMGRALDGARDAHDEALDRLARGNGNVLRQFDLLRKLGARTGKALPVPFDGQDEDEAGDALAPGAARALPREAAE